MTKSNYKKIGNYIQEAKNRNSEQKAEVLLGININKFFMPSVANIVGTDLSRYKLVRENQFACNRMHVGRDYRLPIAMSKATEEFMVSPAYDVFEVIDTSILNPEYLMMWFSRKEFDRNAWFYTDADVRGGLPWSSFCEMELPIPSIEKQREIVAEYNIVQNRINLNNQLIAKLEETAQAIYKQWFVDFEFPDENGLPYKSNGGEMVDSELGEIPKGWEVKSFTNVAKLGGGGTPDTTNALFWNGAIPFFTPADISLGYYCIDTEKKVTKLGVQKSSTKLYPKDTVFVTARGTVGAISISGCEMAMNQSCYALSGREPYYVHQVAINAIQKLKNEAIGAVFSALVTKDFDEQLVVCSNSNIQKSFQKAVRNLYEFILLRINENKKLLELKDLLLSKLAKG